MTGSEPIDLRVARARNQRPRAGNLIALLVAVAAIGAVLTWGTAGIGTARGAPEPAQGSGACSTILAEYPNVNSTMFQEICAEPSFQSALDQWGVTNFSTGTSFGPGWADDYYQFVGVGYCSNTSWGGNDQPCSVQEDLDRESHVRGGVGADPPRRPDYLWVRGGARPAHEPLAGAHSCRWNWPSGGDRAPIGCPVATTAHARVPAQPIPSARVAIGVTGALASGKASIADRSRPRAPFPVFTTLLGQSGNPSARWWALVRWDAGPPPTEQDSRRNYHNEHHGCPNPQPKDRDARRGGRTRGRTEPDLHRDVQAIHGRGSNGPVRGVARDRTDGERVAPVRGSKVDPRRGCGLGCAVEGHAPGGTRRAARPPRTRRCRWAGCLTGRRWLRRPGPSETGTAPDAGFAIEPVGPVREDR